MTASLSMGAPMSFPTIRKSFNRENPTFSNSRNFSPPKDSCYTVLAAFTSLLRTIKETEKLRSLPLEQWLVHAATLKSIKKENEEKVYQCQEVKWVQSRSIVPRTTRSSAHRLIRRSSVTSSAFWQFRDGRRFWKEEAPQEFVSRLVDKFAAPLQWAQRDGLNIQRRIQLPHAVCGPVHFPRHNGLPCCLVANLSCTYYFWVVECTHLGPTPLFSSCI